MSARTPHALALLALTSFAPTACAGGAREPTAPHFAAQAGNGDLAAEEERVVERLSAIDGRLALRFGVRSDERAAHHAEVKAILADDGPLDVFSFEARARELDVATREIDGWRPSATSEARLEKQLFLRLVDAEKARLREERRLPRSASELVRAVVITWTPPATPDRAKERDGWLAHRLDAVTASFSDGDLTAVELDELDDALDALEHLTGALPQAEAALTRLRLALPKVQPGTIRPAWDRVQAQLQAHLGLHLEPATTRTLLETSATFLAREVKRRRLALEEHVVRPLEKSAEERVLVEARCGGEGSRVRGAKPPPERAPICGLLAQLTAVKSADDAEMLPVLMALHDDVAVALWALDVHAGGLSPDAASRAHRLLSLFPPEREARLIRLAAVRSVAAVGAGYAVALLLRGTDGGEPDVAGARRRAERWLAFGDAPLDVGPR